MKLSKWHGLGNDYLLVERAELPVPLTPELVKRICDYHFGVGSDGILEVVSADGDTAEVVIWNPDGSVAELSGNGTRIAARWLARRGGADRVRILVGPRLVGATMRGEREVEQEMGAVDVGEAEAIDVGGEQVELTPVSVGNPHAVIQRLPDRADITVGVWERGAGETLSSGTSAVAASAACVANGWCESPVTVHLAGGDLQVELRDGEATLTGPAEEICTVELAEEFRL